MVSHYMEIAGVRAKLIFSQKAKQKKINLSIMKKQNSCLEECLKI